MIRSVSATFACVLVATLAGPFAQPARSAPAPVLVTLPNGLRVVLAPDSSATAVDVATWFAAGEGSAAAELSGARHIVERQLFLGTADGARAQALIAEGGVAGSATTADAIVTWETMPGEALGLALRTEAARMSAPAPTPAAFAAFRDAAIADAKLRTQQLPLALALSELSARVFAGEPYARPMLPTEGSLRSLTPEAVEGWRKSRCTPANAWITIVGRFEPQATLELVHRVFDRLPRGGAPASLAPPAVRRGELRAVSYGPTPSPLLLAGWRVPGSADPDAAAIDFLADVLGGGDISRIHHALVDEMQVATGGQCGIDRRREGSMLWVAAAVRPDADSSATERMLLDAVGALARDPLPEPEMDRARARFLTNEAFLGQDVRTRAESLAQAVLAGGDPAAASRTAEAVKRLTPADLQRVAQRVLDANARAIVWLLPQGGAR